jgi:hypothetical protein
MSVRIEIFVLDNPFNAAVPVSDDPPIPTWIVEFHGQKRQIRFLSEDEQPIQIP